MKLSKIENPTYRLELSSEEAEWLLRYFLDPAKYLTWSHLDDQHKPNIIGALQNELGQPSLK